jgi:hypothetical protein
MGFFDLQQGEVAFLMDADKLGVDEVTFADGGDVERRVSGGQGKQDPDALGTFDDVGVGHDISVRIDDDAGADAALAGDEGGVAAAGTFDGSESGDQDLDDGGGDFGDEILEGSVEVLEDFWGFGGAGGGGDLLLLRGGFLSQEGDRQKEKNEEERCAHEKAPCRHGR